MSKIFRAAKHTLQALGRTTEDIRTQNTNGEKWKQGAEKMLERSQNTARSRFERNESCSRELLRDSLTFNTKVSMPSMPSKSSSLWFFLTIPSYSFVICQYKTSLVPLGVAKAIIRRKIIPIPRKLSFLVSTKAMLDCCQAIYLHEDGIYKVAESRAGRGKAMEQGDGANSDKGSSNIGSARPRSSGKGNGR